VETTKLSSPVRNLNHATIRSILIRRRTCTKSFTMVGSSPKNAKRLSRRRKRRASLRPTLPPNSAKEIYKMALPIVTTVELRDHHQVLVAWLAPLEAHRRARFWPHRITGNLNHPYCPRLRTAHQNSKPLRQMENLITTHLCHSKIRAPDRPQNSCSIASDLTQVGKINRTQIGAMRLENKQPHHCLASFSIPT